MNLPIRFLFIGFNPVWEETLVFVLRFPEMALLRFVVWDEDPIGRDFIGQFTLPFPSIMPGYRHIHLDGLEQATVFVHISITDYNGSKVCSSPVPASLYSSPSRNRGKKK